MTALLDTTLRDGSYVTNFQFSPKDTFILAAGLDEAGVQLIEVGHGLGLNAGTREGMKSPCHDEAYLEACQSAVRRNRWGMFFIPGIGRIEDIELAARYGMHFVRIGSNITMIEEAEPYIRKAKDLGMFVASNLMKTYAVSADEVGRKAAIVDSYGADIIFIVDSAGGMFPDDIDEYVRQIRLNTDISIGFHGHNNLGMAISNALRAVDLGCAVVDASIRGLGRSSGNTVMEIFLLALKRKGINLGIDITRILDLAENIVDPLLKNYRQVDSIGIISGYAQFHSSSIDKIMNYASRYNIDPRELIVRVSTIDRVNVSSELVESLSMEMANSSRVNAPRQIHVELPVARQNVVSGDLGSLAAIMAGETHSLARKNNSKSVFNIVQAFRPRSKSAVSRVVYEGCGFFVGSAEVSDVDSARCIAKSIDGLIDHVLIDFDKKTQSSEYITSSVDEHVVASNKMYYSDINVWSDSVVQLVVELFGSGFRDKSILIFGVNILGKLLSEKFRLLGVRNYVLSSSDVDAARLRSDCNLVVYCEPAAGCLPPRLSSETIIIDALVGSFEEGDLEVLFEKKVKVLRVDMHLQIHSLLASLACMPTIVHENQGIFEVSGVSVAAGGVVARRGAIVIDSIKHPTKVFGVANGRGFLMSEDEYSDNNIEDMRKVESFIYLR